MITSQRNPTVKAVQALSKRRDRQARGEFLIDGTRELERALGAGIGIRQLLIDPEHAADRHRQLARDAGRSGAEVIEVSADILTRLAYRASTEPLVAVAAMFDTTLDRIQPEPSALVLVMAEVEKPGNIGAMLRTAAAAGVNAVIVADPVADVFNPNVVRASVGALFTMPVAVGPGDEVIGWCRRHHLAMLAATPDGGRPHWEVPMTAGTAIVVGSEHAGLPDSWLSRADGRLTIPMADAAASGADSMNVGTAAAVLLFEAIRQRATS